MRCPFCKYDESKVIDSRLTESGSSTRRRRECLKCFRRFTTYEQVEELPFMVVKKDQRRELFERNKLRNGIIKACEKRPIALEKIEQLIDEIFQELRNDSDHEVSSQTIGEIVADKLRNLDQVAYVRFASVYRQFTDIDSFIKELEIMKKLNNVPKATLTGGN
jgi:transcriptional repressor NrdR